MNARNFKTTVSSNLPKCFFGGHWIKLPNLPPSLSKATTGGSSLLQNRKKCASFILFKYVFNSLLIQMLGY